MPHVINGCGTWYYGKKNVQEYQGVCRACHLNSRLKSYDTRLFIVVLFVPIIPLRRKRIIEECALCRRHHAMPLSEYHKIRQQAQEAITAFRQRPRDSQLAEDAIVACLGYRDLESFLDVAKDIEVQQANNAKLLKILAGSYDIFGRLQDCERMLVAALAVKDEDETRELLGDVLVRQARPDDAALYLQHIIDDSIPDRVGHLFELAQAYQLQAEHEKALALFDHCEQINPVIADDSTFVNLREESAKRLGSGIVVKPNEVVTRIKRKASWKKFRGRAPLVLGLAALAYFCLSWIQGIRHEVFVVNGLYRPYTLVLQGKQYQIAPQSVTKVRTGEGELNFQIVGMDPPAPTQQAAFHSRFLTRPFVGRTFVLNPDGAAILRRTRTFYAERRDEAGEPQHTFSAGQVRYVFEGLDYSFEPFPNTIEMDSHSRREAREGLFLLEDPPDVSKPTLLTIMEPMIGREAAAKVARQHLTFEPQNTGYLRVLAHLSTPKECMAFVRQGLDRRPVQVQWHRFYQDQMRSTGQDEQLEREYESLLATEPTSKDVLYLAGRASRDFEKQVSRREQAAGGDSPCPYAVYAMCGYHLSVGEFSQAAAEAERTLQLLPEEDATHLFYVQAFIAAGQMEKALEFVKKDASQPAPFGLAAMRDEAYLQLIMGKTDEASQTVLQLRDALQQWEEGVANKMVRQLEAQLAYAAGRVDEAVKSWGDSSDTDDQMAALVTSGDLDGAARQAEQDKPAGRRRLLLYVAAKLGGKKEQADKQLKLAIELLSQGDFEDRALAAALAGKPTLTPKDMLRVYDMPARKAIALIALGLRDPANRSAYFELAAKLNYDKRFPHLLIKQALESRIANEE